MELSEEYLSWERKNDTYIHRMYVNILFDKLRKTEQDIKNFEEIGTYDEINNSIISAIESIKKSNDQIASGKNIISRLVWLLEQSVFKGSDKTETGYKSTTDYVVDRAEDIKNAENWIKLFS